jgi:hypothetical protein
MAVPAQLNAASVASIPASPEVMGAILAHYGVDFFFQRTLRTINLSEGNYADAVDEALDRHYDGEDLNEFNLRKAFRSIVAELREDEDFSYEEALEFLTQDDYVVPVDVAQTYSMDAGEMDIEFLSTLIRNRAKRLLRTHAKRASSRP